VTEVNLVYFVRVTNITLRKYRLCPNSSARAGRRSSVGCDGTRSWLRKLVPEAVPGLLRSKTQFAATQIEAANEGRKVKTSAARGHLRTHGKQTRVECKMTDTIMCHAGSKDEHHWYAASV
jgi:hypothetical protein